MRAFLGVLVFLSVLALAYANLKDIGVEQQRVAPFHAAQLYRPVVNFPCSLLLGPDSDTCVHHKLCVTLAGILKAAGCLLLLRVATVSLVRLHSGKVAATGRLLRDGALAPAKLTEIVESPQPAAATSQAASPDTDESARSQPQPAGDSAAAEAGSEVPPQQQRAAVSKKPSGGSAAPEGGSVLQSGLGRLTAVLAVNHALTSLSVKAIVPVKAPAHELKELCLPITAPPASAHLLSSARLALSSAFHRYFPGGPFHTPAIPKKGWQVPSAPYVPINYNGVSFANWASAMFCKKRSSRPPKAPCREPQRALERPSSVFIKRAQRQQRVVTTTVFPAVPVPAVKCHHLTRATAPSMSTEELAVVNRVLDAQLDDVTSFLFD